MSEPLSSHANHIPSVKNTEATPASQNKISKLTIVLPYGEAIETSDVFERKLITTLASGKITLDEIAHRVTGSDTLGGRFRVYDYINDELPSVIKHFHYKVKREMDRETRETFYSLEKDEEAIAAKKRRETSRDFYASVISEARNKPTSQESENQSLETPLTQDETRVVAPPTQYNTANQAALEMIYLIPGLERTLLDIIAKHKPEKDTGYSYAELSEVFGISKKTARQTANVVAARKRRPLFTAQEAIAIAVFDKYKPLIKGEADAKSLDESIKATVKQRLPMLEEAGGK